LLRTNEWFELTREFQNCAGINGELWEISDDNLKQVRVGVAGHYPQVQHGVCFANYRGDRLANIQHVAVAKFEQTHQGFQIKNHDFDLAAFTRWEKNKTLK
jgi:hypothetical protein